VEKVIELSSGQDESIVDVGTGCGAIAVALAGELPSARILAVDVSRRALRAARLNAAALPAGRIRFVEGNAPAVFKKLLAPDSQDFIVSNPPYVSEREWAALMPEIRLFEPKRALVAGPTGLEFIRKLVRSAAVYLKPGGRLVVEIGRGQKDGVLGLLDARWEEVRAFSDLAAVPRIVAARKR
jgi:release factor glutamine methyltransferase